MTSRKLHLAFLWHMHQPYYRNDVNGETIMPWVRLHCLQNYYDIPDILTKGNNLKMTFNLVPSLLLQIENLERGVSDSFEETAKIPAESLTDEQKLFILKNFFMIHPNKISVFPRFASLWEKRGKAWHSIKDDINPGKFSVDEYRDLQVLYHLSWCGWKLQEDPEIAGMINKGADFTEEEKTALFSKLKTFIPKIIPLYKRLKEENRIDISTSPFYHPILPLLVDQNIGIESSPNTILPEMRMKLPSDAEKQLAKGLTFFKDRFGFEAAGIWPSEGSVSNDALAIAAGCGLKWAATDDEILKQSLQNSTGEKHTDAFLTPYKFSSSRGEITLFFRNHYLSDRLGFAYARMKTSKAVDDFISNLKWIYDNSSIPDPLVCIIMDGENAWEFFPDNGREFLSSLAAAIDKTDWLETETLSGFLEKRNADLPKLDRVQPGSWIYGNFTTWIGHSEKNRAWELLLKTRQDADNFLHDPSSNIKNTEMIMNELAIVEGSDWFWWYGDDHHTEFSAEFDSAFRQHLINVYILSAKEPPKYLFEPVLEARDFSGITDPVNFIYPMINGMNGNFFDWRGSGIYNPNISQGAIHRTSFCISQIKFGFNADYLYIRIKTSPRTAEKIMKNNILEISFTEPRKIIIICKTSSTPQFFIEGSETAYAKEDLIFKCGNTVEIGIKWSLLGLRPNDKTEFNAALKENGETIERHPANTNIKITVPDASFEERNWVV